MPGTPGHPGTVPRRSVVRRSGIARRRAALGRGTEGIGRDRNRHGNRGGTGRLTAILVSFLITFLVGSLLLVGVPAEHPMPRPPYIARSG